MVNIHFAILTTISSVSFKDKTMKLSSNAVSEIQCVHGIVFTFVESTQNIRMGGAASIAILQNILWIHGQLCVMTIVW